jgi:RNA polymerase sigma factor (sigma-70 family)
MAKAQLGTVLRHIRGLALGESTRGLSDRQLLERFRADRDEGAFAALVQRHAALVWGVCRGVLRHEQDAEDAWQASFLVLARQAGSIRQTDALAGYLYGVAYRVALMARRQAAARRARERQERDMPPDNPTDQAALHELQALLTEEVQHLPEKYRVPFVLCCLEGKSRAEAAAELGWKEGTVSSRLAQARERLHKRLARRGVVLSAVLCAVALTRPAEAALARLLETTVRAAASPAVGGGAVVSARVLDLMKGAAKPMVATHTKMALALMLTAGFAAGGVGTAVERSGAAAGVGGAAPAAAPAEGGDGKTPPSERPGKTDLYRDMTPGSGVDVIYRNGQEAGYFAPLEEIGGGVALIDYDGDGLLDVLLLGGGTYAGADRRQIQGLPCRLYRNLGHWKFADVTRAVGLDGPAFYAHGVAVADYDCDGWPDLVITGYGGMALYHNESDGKGGRRFVDVTRRAGLTGATWGTSAAWADLDGDGYPDLYVCQYVDWSLDNNPVCRTGTGDRDICPPKQFAALPHKLFHNNRDGTFRDVSKSAGLRTPRTEQDYADLDWLGKAAVEQLRAADRTKDYGKGRGVVVADVNDDGKPDLYVANDTTDNFLYLNRSIPGHIRLEESGMMAGVARDDRGVPTSSHGVAAGDYQNTGRPALWCTNYEGELFCLYENHRQPGRDIFRFKSPAAGIAAIGQQHVGWGTAFLDFDNDGWLDLVIVNGHEVRHPQGGKRGQRPLLLHNCGDGRFVDISEQAGPYFRTDHVGRGLAVGDLDNDGDLDLVICNLNEPAVLLRNEAGGHWLGVELVGKGFRDVTGLPVVVEVGDRRLTRFVPGGGSYLSSGDRRLVFGLGDRKEIDRLTVTWGPRREQHWTGKQLRAGRYWRLLEGQDRPQELYPPQRR